MTDHSGRLIRHTILYFPAQFFPPVVQFATMIVWTHLLHPAGFGIVTFVLAAQEFTALVGISWWSLFLLRFRLRFAAAAGEERFRLMDSLVVACAIIVQIALTPLMLWLSGASIDWVIFLSTAAFFISRTICMHYTEWARTDHLIGAFTATQLIGSILGSGLSIAALMILGPLPSAALGAQAVGYLLALAVLFNKAKLRFRLGAFDATIFGDAMRYGAPLIISGILGWVASNCIRVLVQFSEGAVGLGLLSVGWALGQRIATVLATLFAAATYPLAVSNIEGGDRKGALAQVSLNGVFLLTLLAPATAGVALLSAALVPIIIAAQFRETTIVILPIAIVAAAFRSLRMHISDQTMILLERTRATMYCNMFETVVNVLLCAVGLYYGGLVGAALGVLAGTIAATIVSFAYSFLRLGLPAPTAWTFGRILLATGVMSETVRLMPTPVTLLDLALTIAVGAAAYVVVIILTFAECRALIVPFALRLRGAK
jgi:O-antigen/teichoic acid export membrane protein